jgi:hypothetical protein
MQADASKTSVTGLKGCKRLDKPYEDPANPVEGSEDRLVIVQNIIVILEIVSIRCESNEDLFCWFSVC